MRVGTFAAAPTVGSASWPKSLLPQHATAPVVVRAQVCCPPDVTPRRTVTRAASAGGFAGGCAGGGVTAGGCDSGAGLCATGGGAAGAGTVMVTVALAFSLAAVITAEPPREAVTRPVG